MPRDVLPKILSIVIPCYNEQKTLERCVDNVVSIADEELQLEIIIVDDCSTDQSAAVAASLADRYPNVKLYAHQKNQGKGAALRTGIAQATGDYVAIQDADLEYDPNDLRRLVVPLINNEAEVVLGSRFLSSGEHRVLYFWHSMGNKFLTFLSNMFTDLNLTDMETCYKVFRREVIQRLEIQEDRFGFEPEVVAKIAQMRLRIFEMGISYKARTYEEGKKIGFKDGVRALYCIFKYNAHKAPLPIQFLIYFFVGGAAALVNISLFMLLIDGGAPVGIAAPTAFLSAAVVNYFLCLAILFRHKAKWNSTVEVLAYCGVVGAVALIDYLLTVTLLSSNLSPLLAKSSATAIVFILNFVGRRFIVFPEKKSGPWGPQVKE